MTATTLPAAAARVLCEHCGLDVPAGLVDLKAVRQFCCTGCQTAWSVIQEAGLGHYYELSVKRELAVSPDRRRRWDEFDHPAFSKLYVRERPDGLQQVTLYLEGVHCASCVWLVERVPVAIDGVAETRLDLGRSLATLAWDGARVPLSAIARFLDTLGYRPHPFRGAGAEQVRRAEDRAALVRIGVAAALAANLMTVALAMYAGWFGAMEPVFERYFRWVSLALVIPSLLGPGRVFFRGAWAALRARALHMDLPIAVALGAGLVRGTINTMTGHGPVYFDGLAILVFLLLVGRFLQQRAQRAAVNSAELLHSLQPGTARVIEGDGARDVPVEALVPGMIVDVRAGETFPADGQVVDGRSDVNVALLTGESAPVAVAAGSRVYAGSLNVGAALTVEVQEAGETTRLGRMLKDVAEGASRRAPVVRLADRVAGWFIATALALALVTFAIWVGRDEAAAFDHAIALLIVTCPCALAMATPLAVTAAIGRAARAGMLIKSGDALEQLAHPGVLVLDKTGTLTEGRSALVAWHGPDGLRAAIIALERHVQHPVAEGFRRAWSAEPMDATDVRTTPGGGVEGVVDGRHIVIGSPAFVGARAAGVESFLRRLDASLTPVLVAVDGVAMGVAGFGDPVRADAAAALEHLRSSGWDTELLSGDAPGVAWHVGHALGFESAAIRGGVTPEDKLAHIAARAGHRRPVVMVGDGVNDAPAMARASVGVGVHGGAEACLAAADVFMAKPGLAPLADLVRGARRTMGVIRRNMLLSVGYNLVAVALAMTGHLTPLVAAIMMPLSSVTVIVSSWRSRTFEGAA